MPFFKSFVCALFFFLYASSPLKGEISSSHDGANECSLETQKGDVLQFLLNEEGLLEKILFPDGSSISCTHSSATPEEYALKTEGETFPMEPLSPEAEPPFWSDFCATFLDMYETFSRSFHALQASANEYLTDEDLLPILETLEEKFEGYGNFVMGPTLFRISGYYINPSQSAVFGEGEKYEKLRITFINGILNYPPDIQAIVSLISKTYEGTNIHYIYRGTQGWTLDMVHCILVKMGWISENASQLAGTWKRLINEMGGVGGGGKIIHYAHSIGGTETLAAKKLMTPEELKMIQVITFGSATVLPNEDFSNVINFSGRRDGVSGLVTFLPNPIGHLYFLASGDYHLVLIGSHLDGYPMVDHLFEMYWNYWLEYSQQMKNN